MPKHPAYRPDIDGLRALAVVAVVLFHAFPMAVPGGFVGVDVFFVISGYLITRIIAAELTGGRFSFVEFYSRRARRIFPALILVLVCSLMAGWAMLLADEYERLGKHTAGGSAFVANLLLATEAGYFDVSGMYKPLLHLWSLGVEEQFYLVWPAALLLFWRLGVPLIGLAAMAAVVSFAVCLWLMAADPTGAFYMPHARFWELMVGAALALTKAPGTLRGAAANWLASGGLCLVVISIWFVREATHFPAPLAVAPVLGTAMLIWAGPTSLVSRHILGKPVAVQIGLVSYPLYLWHWPLLSFIAIIFGGEPPLWLRFVALFMAAVLAAATFGLVERPLRRSGAVGSIAVISTISLVGVFAIGMLIFVRNGLPDRPNVQQIAVVQSDFVGPQWPFTQNDICTRQYKPVGVESYNWWFCIQSDASAPEILLLGNSYANHYYPGIVKNPAFGGQTVLSVGGCDPSMVYASEVVPEPNSVEPCTLERRYDQQLMIDRAILDNTMRLVIIAGVIKPFTADYLKRYLERLASIEASGARIIYIVPHLHSGYFIRACFSRPFMVAERDCAVSASDLSEIRRAAEPLIEAIRMQHPRVLIFDPNDVFCAEEVCSFVRDGRPLFRDEYSHLTEYGSALVIQSLVDWLRANDPELLGPSNGNGQL